MKKESTLIIFGTALPQKPDIWWKQFDTVVAGTSLRTLIEARECAWVDFDMFVKPGSIYEATEHLHELALLTLPDGTPLTKSAMYRGYELWWIHHTDLFLHFCLPLTQYRALLEYAREFGSVYLFEPLYRDLFKSYLVAHKRTVHIESSRAIRTRLPLGALLQALLTLVFLPALVIRRKAILVFTSDKFYDYDFRLKFIYEELRGRKLAFMECVRSVQPWHIVLKHAFLRRRAVIYPVGVALIARFISTLTKANDKFRSRYDRLVESLEDPEKRFKFTAATMYVKNAGNDIWAIRTMELILSLIGVKTAFIPAANERSLHTVLASKLKHIPTVGILHGFASRNYNTYDFMLGYSGDLMMSVDTYGVWSEWWREYYLTHSKAYRPKQLVVSGVMRPVAPANSVSKDTRPNDTTHVLFVSEIVALPTEVIPYLDKLLLAPALSVSIKFRATNDSFEAWLTKHRPDILTKVGILKGTMAEAIAACDVVVGSQSTGVIEATLQHKPFVLFNTEKWGDYYDMRSVNVGYTLFAENPDEFVECVRNVSGVPETILEDLRNKFFGNPHKNGSAWVVDQLVQNLKSTHSSPKPDVENK